MKDWGIPGSLHIYLNWLLRVIGMSLPEICLLFMPKMLAMKPSGSYCVRLDVIIHIMSRELVLTKIIVMTVKMMIARLCLMVSSACLVDCHV